MQLFDLLIFLEYYSSVISQNTESKCGVILLNDVLSVFPEIFLAFSLLFLLLHGTLVSSNKKTNYPLTQNSIVNVSILMLIFTLVLTTNFVFSVKSLVFNNTIVTDILSSSSKQCILITSILVLIIVKTYLDLQKINSFEYCVLVLLSIFGLIFLCSANDLMTAYLCIEIQSLSFYLLAAYKKSSVFSVDAGLKYFILGSFSSALFLLGSSVIYGSTGTLNFEDLKDLFLCKSLDQTILKSPIFLMEYKLINFGLACISISLFFKLALAPFHAWSPDVYEGSLSSSTVFFVVLPKISLFVLFVRLFQNSLFDFMEDWKPFFMFIGLLSILTGSFVGLEIRKVKTLLAYSSISHMGYVLLAYGTNCFEGTLAVFSYLIVYMITSICVWSIFLFLRPKNLHQKKTNKDLSDFKGLGKSNLTLAIFFTIFLLSLAGFPPLIGFYVKLKVFLVLIEKGQYFVSVLAIFCSAVSTFYYIRIVKVIFFEKDFADNLFYPLHYYQSIIISAGFFLLILLFINPNPLWFFCYKMTF